MAELDKIIRELSSEAGPTRPLPKPWLRVIRWLAIALPYIAIMVLMAKLRPDLPDKLGDARFVVEQVAAFVTAATAALAAFCAVIPGRSRWTLYLPVPSLVVWLGSLGLGCIADWRSAGPIGFENDLICLPAIALIGALPAIAMALMIRKGAPLFPHLSVALGGLAAAALADFALRLSHPVDAGLMVLVWQFGSVALLSVFAWIAGPRIAHWHRANRTSV